MPSVALLTLTGCLGGELLAGSLASGRLAGGLLGTGHGCCFGVLCVDLLFGGAKKCDECDDGTA